MSDQLITLSIALREAQKLDDEHSTRATLAERKKWELRMDNWIANHMADKIQLDLWTRGEAKKTDDVHTVYNAHDEKAKQSAA